MDLFRENMGRKIFPTQDLQSRSRGSKIVAFQESRSSSNRKEKKEQRHHRLGCGTSMAVVPNSLIGFRSLQLLPQKLKLTPTLTTTLRFSAFRCSTDPDNKRITTGFRTCKNCKTQFDPVLNYPRACRFHTAHFGGNFFFFFFLIQILKLLSLF